MPSLNMFHPTGEKSKQKNQTKPKKKKKKS